jgi:hypothetical protein
LKAGGHQLLVDMKEAATRLSDKIGHRTAWQAIHHHGLTVTTPCLIAFGLAPYAGAHQPNPPAHGVKPERDGGPV